MKFQEVVENMQKVAFVHIVKRVMSVIEKHADDTMAMCGVYSLDEITKNKIYSI